MKLTELLNQIDRLVPELATAPWFVANANEDTEYMPFWQVMNRAYLNEPGTEDDVYCDVEMYVGYESDAEFIALSRSALPQLAKVIDGLIEHCHNVMSWETPRGHEERIAVESRKQGARAVYKAITDTLGADDD